MCICCLVLYAWLIYFIFCHNCQSANQATPQRMCINIWWWTSSVFDCHPHGAAPNQTGIRGPFIIEWHSAGHSTSTVNSVVTMVVPVPSYNHMSSAQDSFVLRPQNLSMIQMPQSNGLIATSLSSQILKTLLMKTTITGQIANSLSSHILKTLLMNSTITRISLI